MKIKQNILNNNFLSISIGIVYLWFGLLKFFPEFSPAEDLAKNTISLLTFHLIPARLSIILLAVLETLIGLFMILNIRKQTTIIVALVHIAFTFSPFILFPNLEFANGPFKFTLLGQYIFKNIIIIGALLTLYKYNFSRKT